MLVDLWLLGAPGAGKSRLTNQLDRNRWHYVDQDGELERMATQRGISMDIREESRERAIQDLRGEAREIAWSKVPAARAAGKSIIFEVTGDRPHLFGPHVTTGHAAGYAQLGIGVCAPLETCIARNRSRARVLPDSVIERAWRAFEQHREAGTYAGILDGFTTTEGFIDVQAWIDSLGPLIELMART